MKYFLIWMAALAAIACGLLIGESDLLWKVQELNLFLDTPLFFKQQMIVAAGLLTYVGTWFTQFFHIAWAGVAMLCAWWLLLLVALIVIVAVVCGIAFALRAFLTVGFDISFDDAKEGDDDGSC